MTAEALEGMYKDNLTVGEKEEFMLGSKYFFKLELASITSIPRTTIYPKSGDVNMIRSYAIDLLVHLDPNTPFNIIDYITGTIKRTSVGF
jgi:hypothetical protein